MTTRRSGFRVRGRYVEVIEYKDIDSRTGKEIDDIICSFEALSIRGIPSYYSVRLARSEYTLDLAKRKIIEGMDHKYIRWEEK
jgi:hypothetical protein